MMPPHLFLQGLRVNAIAYIELLSRSYTEQTSDKKEWVKRHFTVLTKKKQFKHYIIIFFLFHAFCCLSAQCVICLKADFGGCNFLKRLCTIPYKSKIYGQIIHDDVNLNLLALPPSPLSYIDVNWIVYVCGIIKMNSSSHPHNNVMALKELLCIQRQMSLIHIKLLAVLNFDSL